MPQVSVIIPSIGRAPVGRAVSSVVESSGAAGVDTEVIVVWQAAGEPPDLPGATVLAIHDVNVSFARNRGAEAARSPVLGYVDDDEVVDVGWVAALVAAIDGVDAAFGPIDPLDEQGRPHCLLEHGEERVYEGYVAPWLVGSGGNMIVRAEALRAGGGFDLRMGAGSIGRSGEETAMIWSLLVNGMRIRWAPDMIVHHPTKTDAEILASRHPYGYGAGRVLRHARRGRLVANYANAIVRANLGAIRARDARGRREAATFGRGVVAGMLDRPRWIAPELDGEDVPTEVVAALGDRTAQPLAVPWGGRPHFVWDCGDLILHAYVAPDIGQIPAPQERERIRSLPGVQRIPAVIAHARSRDALWVLEERVEGRHPDCKRPQEWWAGAAAWITTYARHDGRLFGESEEYRTGAEPWRDSVSGDVRGSVAAALERMAGRPSGPAHGDLQPKNLVIGAAGVTAIDWEYCTIDAMRGLDLLMLAATHAGVIPDEAVLRGLAEGRNPAFGDVLGPLREVGLEGQALKDTLLVVLVKWAFNERKRHVELGSSGQQPTYARMLQRVGALLM
jgi:GT2 family glycosyltransferase